MLSAQSPKTGTIHGNVKDLVAGRYLENAQVSLAGTNITTATDADGYYQISSVPAGTVTLSVFYSGMQTQTQSVDVPAGGTVEQDFGLVVPGSSLASGEGVVHLDKFVVTSTRETNALEIAVNEQRFSPNMKSVVAVDAYGPLANHNVGEFLKWLPGVGVEYFANNITGVNVNGLGSINTEIEFGGVREASAFTESTDRGFQMKASSIADVQRVEIRKMPLPEDSANSIGGTLNLIPRSAFEYDRPISRYQAYVTSDGERMTWNERDGPKDRQMQYWRPNFEYQFTDPITRNFGIALSISHDDKIVRTHWSQPGWQYGSAAQNDSAPIPEPDEATAVALANAAIAAKGTPVNYTRYTNPANQSQLLHDAPIWDTTDSLSLRADWRLASGLTLSNDVNYTNYTNQTADDVRYSWNTGTAIYADAHTTDGTPGKGNAYFNTPLWRDQYEPRITDTFTARWKRDRWTFNLIASYSFSRHEFADTKDGFFDSSTQTGNNPLTGQALFSNIGIGTGTAHPIPVTVNFRNQSGAMPQTIEMFDASGNPIDWSKASNLYIGGFRSKPSKAYDMLIPFRISLRRDFDLWNNPSFVKAGFDFSDEFYNKQRYDELNWVFVGPDHKPNTADDNAAQIAATTIGPERDNIYNAPPIEHISMSRAYRLYQLHPDWFQFQDVASYAMSAEQPFEWEERYYAPYLEGSIQLFHNRLGLEGGVRFEEDRASGRGFLNDPNGAYQKYSDGITPKNTADLLNSDGTPQRYSDGTVKRTGDTVDPATGLPTKHAGGSYVYLPGVTKGSMQEAQLTYIRKGAYGSGSNHGYFPSLHATYHITDNFLFRAAYAKTQAKNRLDRSVIPNTTISDTPSTHVSEDNLGEISVRNPGLVPWTAYLYQGDLEYYTKSGGYIEAGAFMRSIHHFQQSEYIFIDSPETAAKFGLGADAVDYVAHTYVNTTSVKIAGAEFAVAQRLDPFVPSCLAGFTFRGGYTYNNYKGDVALTGSDFNNLYDDRETAFLSYHRWRVDASVGYIRTGYVFQQIDNASGNIPGVREYVPQNQWDASLQFELTPWANLYLAVNNITNEQKTRDRLIQGAPDYSRLQIENTLGRTYSIGVTGSF